MKTATKDPWSTVNSCMNHSEGIVDNSQKCFEDSFVLNASNANCSKLSDSEQYLSRLYSRLKVIQGGTSKHDLINSLAVAKEDCIARLITAGQKLETVEEKELAANPIIRHITPHLQALTANELVHLLKADVLQDAVDEQNHQSIEN